MSLFLCRFIALLLSVVVEIGAAGDLPLVSPSCEDLLKNLGRGDAVDFSVSEGEVLIPAFGAADWKPYRGKKITAVFNPDHKIDQVVLGREDLPLNVNRAIEQLRHHTHIGWPFRFLTVESGIWMISGDSKTTYSKIFTSKNTHTLYYDKQGKIPFETMMRKRQGVSSREEPPKELTLFHTHPGKGEPLNKFDIQAIESIANKAFKDMPSLQVVTLFAIPTKNSDSIYFRYRVFRK